MKRILLALIVSVFSLGAFAQITYDNPNSYEQFDPNITVYNGIMLTNSGNHAIDLSWVMIQSTLKDFGNPDGSWQLGYCECNNCYTNDFAPLLSSNSCADPMQPGAQKEWYLQVALNGVPAQDAEWVIEVYNETDNIRDTLTYFMREGVVTVKSIKSSAAVKVFPNPANDHLVVDFNLEGVQVNSFEIYNAVGALVKVVNVNSLSSATFNVSTTDLENGMYVYVLKSGEFSIASDRFSVIR